MISDPPSTFSSYSSLWRSFAEAFFNKPFSSITVLVVIVVVTCRSLRGLCSDVLYKAVHLIIRSPRTFTEPVLKLPAVPFVSFAATFSKRAYSKDIRDSILILPFFSYLLQRRSLSRRSLKGRSLSMLEEVFWICRSLRISCSGVH